MLQTLIVAIGADCCVSSSAAESHGSMLVSATVRPVATLEQQSEPVAITLSAQDVERGFIDISDPTQLRVHSNSREGYIIELLAVSPMFSSIAVHGLGSDVTLGAEGGSIVQRWDRAQSVSLALTFRLKLAAGLQPGQYPWPLRMRVRAL